MIAWTLYLVIIGFSNAHPSFLSVTTLALTSALAEAMVTQCEHCETFQGMACRSGTLTWRPPWVFILCIPGCYSVTTPGNELILA